MRNECVVIGSSAIASEALSDSAQIDSTPTRFMYAAAEHVCIVGMPPAAITTSFLITKHILNF
jgi:hypothetical protein